jgi:hypothetical protein
MALDVHLVTDRFDPSTSRAVFQWDEPEHAAVFGDDRLDFDRFPMLRRMADHYADAQFAGDEIVLLLDELAIVIPMHNRRGSPHASLVGFQKVCEQAVAQRKKVVCVCD